jgi:hypothetical protein
VHASYGAFTRVLIILYAGGVQPGAPVDDQHDPFYCYRTRYVS